MNYNRDTLYQILLHVDDADLNHLCNLNHQTQSICQSNIFGQTD